MKYMCFVIFPMIVSLYMYDNYNNTLTLITIASEVGGTVIQLKGRLRL